MIVLQALIVEVIIDILGVIAVVDGMTIACCWRSWKFFLGVIVTVVGMLDSIPDVLVVDIVASGESPDFTLDSIIASVSWKFRDFA